MITRDFFMRMIHQLAQALAKVLRLNSEQQYEKSLETIGQTSKELLGMDLRMLTSLNDAEFVKWFSLGDRFDVEKCVVAAELLRMVGDVRSLEGDEVRRQHSLVVSLSLFLELLQRESGSLPAEYYEKIESLIAGVTRYEIPVGLKMKLIRYYEAVGRYDSAENLLFDALEEDVTIAEEGTRLYGRLKEKSDEELARGNLPREELDKGLEDFTRLSTNALLKRR